MSSSVDKKLFAYTGVIIPFDGVVFGAGISRRATLSLPLKIKLDLDVKEKTLQAKWTPVVHQVYHFSYQPYTFVDSYLNTVPMTLEESYMPVKRLSQKKVRIISSTRYKLSSWSNCFSSKVGQCRKHFRGHWFDYKASSQLTTFPVIICLPLTDYV